MKKLPIRYQLVSAVTTRDEVTIDILAFRVQIISNFDMP